MIKAFLILFVTAGMAADVPENLLTMWRVEKVWADENATFHFYGYDHGGSCGRVSTAILSFGPSTMIGETESGRIYHLIGQPDSAVIRTTS